MSERRLRIGVAGLGRAFMLMQPAFCADPRVELVAGADPRAEATQRFAAEFGARTYASVEALCADRDVDVVYIATPHPQHAAHAELAAAAGKHILVEKPMAITLDECRRMTAAAARAGVCLVVGHGHSFDRPIARTRELIAGGEFGGLRMITAQCYTDFLYRPRIADELDAQKGGGAVLNQGSHQVDIVRLLGGGRVQTVRALVGAWDRARPAEGAYAALLTFADGAFASLVYSGYGHFDSAEFCGGIGEMGVPTDARGYGAARRSLQPAAGADAEAQLRRARNYGGADCARVATGPDAPAVWHQHFGVVLASCERADLRPLPTGVMIYADAEARLDPLPRPRIPRVEVIDELHAAVFGGRPPLHDGRWATATLEVCLAIRQSAQEAREISLHHQAGVPA